MFSLFFLLLIVDFLLLTVMASISSLAMIVTTAIWTYFIYVVLILKGVSFRDEDPLVEKCGRLFHSTKGILQSTVIASLNMIVLAMIIDETSLKMIEEIVGPFSSIMIFIVLPLPSFLLISVKTNEQKDLYEQIYHVVSSRDSHPEFIEHTMNLITMKDRFSKEYSQQLSLVRDSTFNFIKNDLGSLSSFFMPEKSFHFNLEYLAMFLTKRLTGLPE